MYYIYLIKKDSVPVYVGFTSKTIEERWKTHIKDSKKKKYILHKSMNKNGIECFTVEKLYESEDLNHTLNYMEHHFIWLYKTHINYGGYNMTLGGDGTIKLGTLSKKERKKLWCKKNKIYQRNKAKQYYEKNKEEIKNNRKKYYEKNKEEIKNKRKQYRKQNKQKFISSYQSSSGFAY